MTTAFAALASFFAGIALACVIMGGREFFIAPRIKKCVRARRQLTAFFITLSVAAACAALAVIFFPDEQITFGKGAVPYYCAFAAAGIASGIWRRTVFPLAVLLYACYGLWSRAPLAKLFPAPERAAHIVRIDSDSVILIDDARYEFEAGENERVWTLVFEQYKMPARWLVPFPANFFRLAGVSPQKDPAPARMTAAQIKSPMPFSILKTPFAEELRKSRIEQTLRLQAAVHPAEYKIDCAIKNKKFTAAPTKIF